MTLNLAKKEQKAYWKELSKLNNNSKENSSMGVPNKIMLDHFKNVLYEFNSHEYPSNSSETGDLDYKITNEELKLASSILKSNKAPGLDNILNEMITPLIDSYPEILLKLFNKILQTNDITIDWKISLIVTIHKKGAKDDPSNYRGISLLSCIGKLFFTILNNRLAKFTLDKKILSDNQLGFFRGNRTSDPHIILNNLIQKYCHKRKKYIYGCFVDFSKAVDTVPRDILLNKLKTIGVTGKFFNIIKTIYSEDKACLKLGNNITDSFQTNKGVRQGCVLSPLLFNIFLSDLPGGLNSCEGNIEITENKKTSCLVWADDILILSESESGLQAKLNNLEKYCDKNRLTVNTEKTKCMIFNKTGRLIKREFVFKNDILENTRSYKYLGFMVTPSGEIKSGLDDLRIRSLKALMKLQKDMGSAFKYNVKNTIHLYNYLVKSIILYASDFWGCFKLPKNNPIEKTHNMFCRYLLGVQKHTTTIGILLELVMVPITLYAIRASIKNWERIRDKRANILLQLSLEDATREKLPWISTIKNHLESNGMMNLFLQNNTPYVHKLLFQRLSDHFHQNAFETIQNNNSKLRTYSLIKRTIGLEDYLLNIHNTKNRIAMSKLRLSNHVLLIESGRHLKLDQNLRVCPFCPKEIEDEIHFLLFCPTYKELRTKLLYPALNINRWLSHKEKLCILFTNDTVNTTAAYIRNAFLVRESTIMLNTLKVHN